jgi:hypothetical protein
MNRPRAYCVIRPSVSGVRRTCSAATKAPSRPSAIARFQIIRSPTVVRRPPLPMAFSNGISCSQPDGVFA